MDHHKKALTMFVQKKRKYVKIDESVRIRDLWKNLNNYRNNWTSTIIIFRLAQYAYFNFL